MSERPFRVLCLDGGGMRGTYTATYLDRVARMFAHRRGVAGLDVGAGFDLIVGTSVGGIIGCGLAAGIPLDQVTKLFLTHGRAIFARKLPTRLSPSLLWDMARRPDSLRSGMEALSAALEECFGDETLAKVYARRRIALAVPAVELSTHKSWVFKTPHWSTSNQRDNDYRLVDVCLATSAAPIYRSLASLESPDDPNKSRRVFADGGLWANNPVLVGLIEALRIADSTQPIQVFSLGTCARPAGEQIAQKEIHRGLKEWRFGGLVAPLAIDAQEFAFDHMAQMLVPHLGRPCTVLRFPSGQVPAALMPYLDLDDARPEAMQALINQARSDADMTNSICDRPGDSDGRLICELFTDMPVLEAAQVQKP